MDAAGEAVEGAAAEERKAPCEAAADEAPQSAAERPAVPEKAAASLGDAAQGPAEGASGAPGSSAAAGAASAASPEGLGSREGAPAASGAPPRAPSAAGEGPHATSEPSAEPSPARGENPKGEVWVGHREDRRPVAPPRRGYTLRFHLIAASGAELLAATGEDQGAGF